MDILGIGPLELFFILLIALIVLGPKDMVKAGRTLGKFMRSVVTSPNWHMLQQASREIRGLPNRLIREAGIEEFQKDLSNSSSISRTLGFDEIEKDIGSIQSDMSDWTTPPQKDDETPGSSKTDTEGITSGTDQRVESTIDPLDNTGEDEN
jgi:hypothetical protein